MYKALQAWNQVGQAVTDRQRAGLDPLLQACPGPGKESNLLEEEHAADRKVQD